MRTGWVPSGCHFDLKMRTGWHSHPVVISKSKWQSDEYAIRLSFTNKMTFFLNDNRMGLPSGCHFILKWQPDKGVIWLSFYFEMTIGWGVIRFSFYFKMTTEWHTHPIIFFLKYEPDGGVIQFYFFVHVNSTVRVVELKFCIGVLEECIRIQEEFVIVVWVAIYNFMGFSLLFVEFLFTTASPSTSILFIIFYFKINIP